MCCVSISFRVQPAGSHLIFFFKQMTAYEMRISDWSSDVCSSDLVTLNFDGVDYVGNTILFPTGNHANGTWRLQIKGVSPSQVKITDAFRAKGEDFYLVKKIITFTEIDPGYFFMSV